MPKKINPKRCPECGERSRVPAVIEYRSSVELDRRMVEVHVAELAVEQCSSCNEVFYGSKAGIAIDEATRNAAGRLAPSDIARARKVLGNMTQKALAGNIGVAPEVLSRWSKGHVIQGRLADTMLRVFFGVPEARGFLERLWAAPEADRPVEVIIDRSRPSEYAISDWKVPSTFSFTNESGNIDQAA